MSDPAVEAALKASSQYETGGQISLQAISAAREALKPIRELHTPYWSNCMHACCSGEDCRLRSNLCVHCEVDWPCATSRLVYAEEELS